MTPSSLGATLHIVDIENLAGDAYPPPWAARWALTAYGQVSGHRTGDLAYVAANRYLLAGIGFHKPFSCQLRTASGPDGADLALIDAAPSSWVGTRFRRLVVGSGDHAFVPLAVDALEAGLEVVVVARRGTVAREFHRIGCEVRYLPEPELGEAAALPGEAA